MTFGSLFCALCCAFAPQDHGITLRADRVPGVYARALWVALPLAWPDDIDEGAPLRLILGECLRSALPAANEFAPVQVIVLEDAVLVGCVTKDGELAARLAAISGWFRGELDIDDATVERARDVAVLRADDSCMVLPGPMLRGRAMRRIGTGREAMAVTAAQVARMHRLEVATIRARFTSGVSTEGAAVVLLGGETDALPQLEAACATVPPRVRCVVAPAAKLAVDEPDSSPHERVLGPFVAAAFEAPAPDDPGWTSFLIATEIVRARAAFRLGDARGREAAGGFPPVWFDFLGEPRLFFLERRGRDGSDAAAAREEILGVLDSLHRAPPDDREIDSAVAGLRTALALPPFDEPLRNLLASNHSVLLGRGRIFLFDALSKIGTELRSTAAPIDTTLVRSVLDERFGNAAARFFELLPLAPETAR